MTDTSNLRAILESCTHALSQVESLVNGCEVRAEQIKEAKVRMDFVYGPDIGRTVALAVAHGANGDVVQALGKAAVSLREQIGHLYAAANPGS